MDLKLKAERGELVERVWLGPESKDNWKEIEALLRSIPVVYEGLGRGIPWEKSVFVGCFKLDTEGSESLEISRDLTIGTGIRLSDAKLASDFWTYGILTSDEFDDLCVGTAGKMARKLFNYVIQGQIIPLEASAGIERVEIHARVEVKDPPQRRPVKTTDIKVDSAAEVFAALCSRCWGQWDAAGCS